MARLFSAETRVIVERAHSGGFTLADVFQCVYGSWLEAVSLRNDAVRDHKAAQFGDKEAPGLRTITMLDGVAARYLDQMRQIVALIAPPLDAGKLPPKLPDGMSEAEIIARVTARRVDEIVT